MLHEGSKTSAVVVGANLNGLGVARSLRVAGVPVTILGVSRRQPGMWARGCRTAAVRQLHGQELIDTLVRLRRTFDNNPVLFLTDEMAVFTVSERRRELERIYRFALPSPEMVTALSDKVAFHALAEAHDLPAPRSATIETAADILKLQDLALPIIVKPSDKRAVHTRHAERIERIENRVEAEQACLAMAQRAGAVIAQEWIPGPDSDIVFCLFYAGRDGEVVSAFSGRKLLCDPPGIGSTGLCIAAPDIGATLEDMTGRFIKRTGFVGMGSIEFKWHAGRREFLVIEPTVGRTDWQEEIATLCGENIPYRAYRHELGLPPPIPRKAVRSVAWRATVKQRWPRDLPRTVERVYDALWRPDDPLPVMAMIGDAGLRRIEKLVSRLMQSAERADRPGPISHKSGISN